MVGLQEVLHAGISVKLKVDERSTRQELKHRGTGKKLDDHLQCAKDASVDDRSGDTALAAAGLPSRNEASVHDRSGDTALAASGLPSRNERHRTPAGHNEATAITLLLLMLLYVHRDHKLL